MATQGNKHENYEVLNLIGYGLSKFNDDFIKEFGFSTKTAFYNYCVENDIAETVGTIKNRQDLFDQFFPENGRKGWHQKGDAYIHRKVYIDSLFGNENVKSFADIVKMYFKEKLKVENVIIHANPLTKSKYRRMQETGAEAELYFIHKFQEIDIFKGGLLEDARLYGDGYDFQITVEQSYYLTDVKAIRGSKGKFRLSEKEYNKAQEYQDDYIVTIVLNLDDIPTFLTVENPVKNLKFKKDERTPKPVTEYFLMNDIC